MDPTDITLIIPDEFAHEFLGILTLDVLHDAKGRGYLAGSKLYQITDLVAHSFMEHNLEVSSDVIETLEHWVFKKVLRYFLKLWELNIAAFGLSAPPDFNMTNVEYWSFIRQITMLPVRNVADREDEDVFASLGGNKYGAEAQNYHDQKQKLEPQHAEILSFISPHGINTPSDYFRQASGIVDIIKQRTANRSKAVLDMKSAAGLLRTITDPLGYITGLPTYADPGYNMPGMSAIRQHSENAFLNKQDLATNQYRGPSEFKYSIKMQTPVSKDPLTLVNTDYFYGVAASGLDRSNMIITILGEVFKGTLPRSTMMAEALDKYLTPSEQELTMTTGEILETLQSLMITTYIRLTEPIDGLKQLDDTFKTINTRLSTVQTGQIGEISAIGNSDQARLTIAELQEIFKDLDLDISSTNTEKIIEWLYSKPDQSIRNNNISYLLSTLRYVHLYDIEVGDILPSEMVTTVLPELMYDYLENKEDAAGAGAGTSKDLNNLAYCYHMLRLLEHYIQDTEDATLEQKLNKQWLPHRKGKLTTQINKCVLEWRKTQSETLLSEKKVLHGYILKLLEVCHKHLERLHTFRDIESDELDVNNLLTSFLQLIPYFEAPAKIKTVLEQHLIVYHQELYTRSKNSPQTGLLVIALLDSILWKKPLVNFNINFSVPMKINVAPSSDHYKAEAFKLEALQALLGKFSGDFGQIVWCICNGHIFSSEDNNTSAMAVLLHRLPKQFIKLRGEQQVWGNIHGLGDGGCVDIIIDQQNKKRKL